MKFPSALLFLLFTVCVSGCTSPPEIAPVVKGTVTLRGKPLPSAEVTFIPLQKGLDGNFKSSALTDSSGRFVLTFPAGQGGAVICEHVVIVSEGPVPDEFRGQDGDSQLKALEFLESMENRPIPEIYASPARSPLKVVVKPDQEEYILELQDTSSGT